MSARRAPASDPQVAPRTGEVKTLWIVFDPGPESILCDICCEQDLARIDDHVIGATQGDPQWWREHHPRWYLDEASAQKDAKQRLKKRDAHRASRRAKYEVATVADAVGLLLRLRLGSERRRIPTALAEDVEDFIECAQKVSTLTERQRFVARAHFDLLRAIAEGAGHSPHSTPGVRPLLDAGLVAPGETANGPDESYPVEITSLGQTALRLVRADCEGNPAHDHRAQGRPGKRTRLAKKSTEK